MKITILVNRDLPALLALNYLLPSLCEHKLRVFYTHKAPINDLPTALQQLANFERKALSDTQSAADHKSLLSFEQLGRYTCADIVRLNSVNGSDFNVLQKSQPDLIVSIRHMTILKEAVIKLPRLGVINLHSGLLPNYQGVMSTFRAMLNREPTLGSTLHFIEDKEIDSGAIIAQAKRPIRLDKSYLWNVLSLYQSGCQLIQEAIACLASQHELNSVYQDGPSNYYSFPNEHDLNEFDSQEFELFKLDDLNDFQISAN